MKNIIIWLSANAAKFGLCYLAFHEKLQWADNLVVTFTWMNIALLGITVLALALNDELLKKRASNKPITFNANSITSAIFAMIVNANGYIVSGGIMLILVLMLHIVLADAVKKSNRE